ncbi:MAG: hypothetical protein V4519_00065 [Patescibacteria group bacterium]
MKPTITFDDFAKIEITIGKILSVEKVPETDKLLKLSVSFGTEIRQIVSGISQYLPDAQVLIGKKCPFVTNLEPRTIKGLESQAMILAVSTDDGLFSLLQPNEDIPEGTRAK